MFKGEKSNKTYSENPDRLNRLVSGTKITGDIVTESSLRIDGEINGNVKCMAKLVLGKEGFVTGNINAIEVEVDGKIEGSIDAADILILHKTARVDGDVIAERLVIEDGAELTGNIQVSGKGQVNTKSPKKQKLEKKSTEVKTSELVY